jgi:putative transposase
MSGYYFNVGARFLINDNEYLVRRELDFDYEIENLDYKKIELRRKTDLLTLWLEGTLLFRVNKDEENLIRVQNLDDLDEKAKKEAVRRFNILKPVIKGEVLPSEIKPYLESLGGAVKKSAFYEWKQRWEKAEDIRALVSFKPGPKKARTQERTLKILDESIEYYLYSDGKFTLEDMFSEFRLRIDEDNINRKEEEKLDYVSRSTLRRRKEEIIDIYKLDKEKYGTVLAKLKRDGSKQEVIATRPLQRVEIDWTPVDVMLIDPSDLKPKRPNLIYAVDKCTGIPLGFFVTFKPVDSNALKQCLIHLIMPKTYLKDLYPEVENEWISYGIPHTIVVDNASVNDSYEFEEACYQVGVKEVQFCKIDAGHQKATIERAFRSLNTMFVHNLKGTTFSNFIEKGRYDSAKKACITMQGFIYMAHIAMVDMVANEYDSTRGDSPHNLWLKGTEENKRLKLQIPRSVESLKILLVAGSKLRKIQQQGVVIENEYYFSKELMELKNLFEKHHREDEEVRVRFDLSDMRKVYVYDPINKKYIVAEGKGFKRKNINNDLPVPYQVLELDSKLKTETKKSFNPNNRAISKRKIRIIQEEDEKLVKKWRKGQDPDKTNSSSFIIDTVLNTETEIDIPLFNEGITIIENEKSSKEAGKKKNEPQKAKHETKISYMEYDDTDLEDLPNWDISFKK